MTSDVMVSIPREKLLMMRDIIVKMLYPESTYNEDKLVMAEGVIRKTRRYARQAEDLINGWIK